MKSVEITAKNLTKIYKLYDNHRDRFKEALNPRRKKYHRDFYALNDVNFEIYRGETVGIVGRNGSGKSTLLKMLTGVLNPTEGEITVNGKISALLELGAGFNMEYTGMENIYLNGTIMGISRKEMEKKVDDIVSFADIGEHINQPVKTYSSGMFVRLAFAVAINVDPDILIVDEALAVGDTRFQVKCMDKFMEFMERGKTVLFVSHDLHSIKRFCTRTIWINDGKMIMDGKTDEVTDRYADFLKTGLTVDEYFAKKESGALEKEYYNPEIAEILSLSIHDKDGNEIEDIEHGKDVIIKVEYNVADEKMENAVLGVAIRTIDNKYICGLNTLLDNHKIPWKSGKNTCELFYEGFNLVGGSYYFDAAIFDKTATVPIDYRTKIKTFFVKMGYIAEGVVVLKHNWNNK